VSRINTGDHPGSCVQCGGDAPEGVPICTACGVEEYWKSKIDEVVEEATVLREQLDELRVLVRQALEVLPLGPWTERVTRILQTVAPAVAQPSAASSPPRTTPPSGRPETAMECVDRLLPDAVMLAAAIGQTFWIPCSDLRKATHNSKFKGRETGQRTENHCRTAVYGALSKRWRRPDGTEDRAGRAVEVHCPSGATAVKVTKVG